MPRELERLQLILTKGMIATELLWSDVQVGFTWIHRAAHLLTNSEQQTSAEVRRAYEALLAEMAQIPIPSEMLLTMTTTFRKVTTSYFPGLFHCYDSIDLPRTNNDLEQYFGTARYHERRATGRKGASPGMVVRGAVRVVACVATRLHHFCAADLQPPDIMRWYTLRDELDMRQQARRVQFRFRRNPDAYLATLEKKLLQLRLPT